MARNRKNNAAIRFVPAMKAVVICLLLGASSVGYVLQKNKIFELGREIKEREERHSRLEWENSRRAAKLRDLLSPPNLKASLRRHGLDLALPNPSNVIWLSEPTLTNDMTSDSRYLAWRRSERSEPAD
jgi:hypothetical protein